MHSMRAFLCKREKAANPSQKGDFSTLLRRSRYRDINEEKEGISP